MKIILEYKKPKDYQWDSFSTGCIVPDNYQLKSQLFYGSGYTVFKVAHEDVKFPVSHATEHSMYYFINVGKPSTATRCEMIISERVKIYSTIAKLSSEEYKHVMNYVDNADDHKALLVTGEYLKSIGNEVRYFCFS